MLSMQTYVDIMITELYIEYESSCDFDYLEIQDVSTGLSAKLCGKLAQYSPSGGPFCIRTNSSRLQIHFSSDSIITASGFALNFEVQGQDMNMTTEYECDQYYSLSDVIEFPIR